MAQTRIPFCSPYRLFLPFISTTTGDASEIHEAYARFIWRIMGLHHKALVALLVVLWPILFVIMAIMFTRKIGPVVRRTTGKSITRQLWEQLRLSIFQSIPPDKYYVFELFRPDRFAQANAYILRYEMKGAFHNLMHTRAKNDPRLGNTKSELTDKLSFSRRCRSAAVEAPIILAIVDRESEGSDWMLQLETFAGPGLPRRDIFIKPSKGKGGRGCEKWRFFDERYVGPNGERLNEEDLLSRIVELASKRGRYLIQECLQNYPDLRDLSSGLTSLRVTCCRNENDEFEVTNATLKLSFAGNSSVDNFHQGGGVAMVDILTGKVGPASDSWKDRPCVWHKVHPSTGAAIEGRVLPEWNKTVRMVEKAHSLFPDRIMLGFDVAITDRGPVIIEGNVQSGCDMIQRTHDRAVGNQRLGELLSYHASLAIRLPLPIHPMNWFGPWDYFRPR